MVCLVNKSNEVILSKEINVHDLNLRCEIIGAFKDDNILDFDIRCIVIDHRGNKEEEIHFVRSLLN